MMQDTIPVHGDDLTFVDAHQHFQDISRFYYPWLCDRGRPPQLEGDLEPIRRNYLPSDYAADAARFSVKKTVHVQNGWDPSDPVGETRWLISLAKVGGIPTAIVAFADLAAPDVEHLLEAHADFPSVRGIRQILNWHADPMLRVATRLDLMEQSDWRRGFSLLRRHNLSFDLQIYWPQMDMALALAKRYPDTILILNHFGMPIDRSRDGVDAWSSAMMRLARAPNVFVKLSGFGLGHPCWTIDDTGPLLRHTIETFGPERVMAGTNLPVDRLFAEAPKILQMIHSAVVDLSSEEKREVLGGTAERVYRI